MKLFHSAQSSSYCMFMVRCLALMLGFSFASVSVAEPLRVVITADAGRDSQDPSYFYQQVLILALTKTQVTDGEFELGHNAHGGGIARDRAMVIAGAGIDVMWATATKEREEQMRVVPVDLLKGLNNYRLLLIRKDSQLQFNQVKTLNDLKRFTAGSGEHWTDGFIMKDNGFSVVLTSSYFGLFKMLAARRFDFIPRGLHEVGYDAAVYKEFTLEKEKNILLSYSPAISYCFFVNKNNLKLADRIERGLKIAQQDGSFDKLFYQVPSFKEGEEILKRANRIVLDVKNTKK